MHILKQVLSTLLILGVVFTTAGLVNRFSENVLPEAKQGERGMEEMGSPEQGKNPLPARTLDEGSTMFSGLESNLKKEIALSNRQVRLCLYDFETGEQIALEAHRSLYPASMIKTLLLLSALEQAEQGKFSLDSLYRLKESDKYIGSTPVIGTGILQYAEAGTPYTMEKLLNLMISHSDNIAANIIFEKIGGESCAALAEKLGLRDSAFTRKMYDLDSDLPSNKSTAYELTQMLIALQNREIAEEALTRKGIAMLTATVDKSRIGRYLERRAIVANKIGTVGNVVGDMALIYFPERPPLALTVVVENPTDPEEAAALIGRLAKLIVDRLDTKGTAQG